MGVLPCQASGSVEAGYPPRHRCRIKRSGPPNTGAARDRSRPSDEPAGFTGGGWVGPVGEVPEPTRDCSDSVHRGNVRSHHTPDTYQSDEKSSARSASGALLRLPVRVDEQAIAYVRASQLN